MKMVLEQKKNSLEGLITIMSNSSTSNEPMAGRSLPKVYQEYLKSMMESKSTSRSETAAAGIKIKTNEV